MERIILKGKIHFLGKHVNGEVFCNKTIDNTITTAGKTLAATLLYGTGTAYSALAIGSSSGGTTALSAEILTSGGLRRGDADVTKSNPSGAIAQWLTLFTFTGALAITEEGIFNSSVSSSGTMLACQTFGAINVVDTDTLQVTHQVTLS